MGGGVGGMTLIRLVMRSREKALVEQPQPQSMEAFYAIVSINGLLYHLSQMKLPDIGREEGITLDMVYGRMLESARAAVLNWDRFKTMEANDVRRS
jgi:hypothetical protein